MPSHWTCTGPRCCPLKVHLVADLDLCLPPMESSLSRCTVCSQLVYMSGPFRASVDCPLRCPLAVLCVSFVQLFSAYHLHSVSFRNALFCSICLFYPSVCAVSKQCPSRPLISIRQIHKCAACDAFDCLLSAISRCVQLYLFKGNSVGHWAALARRHCLLVLVSPLADAPTGNSLIIKGIIYKSIVSLFARSDQVCQCWAGSLVNH